jgi:hypothetical protein
MLLRQNDNNRLAIWAWQSALVCWLHGKPIFKYIEEEQKGETK